MLSEFDGATSVKAKLTESFIAKATLPAGKTRLIFWDTTIAGFGLRCAAGGGKSFVLVYRPHGLGRSGPSRTLTLGGWPSLSVEAARKTARAKLGDIAHGKDPAAEVRAARWSKRATLRAALDGYEASLQQRRVVAVPAIMSCLARGLSALTKREVGAITRADYVRCIDALDGRGKTGAAGYLRKNARTFAEWAVTQGLASHNPLAGLRRPKATRAERLEAEQRGRALNDAEIAALWQATSQTMHPFGDMIRLGLLSGMRRGELAGLTWANIKPDRITLEATHTKQGRRHEIPITKAMRDILTKRPRGTSNLVFPSQRTGGEMSGWNKMLAKVVKASGVQFTLHDTRRTCRTLMSTTGTTEDIAEIAIGHQRSDLIRRYDFSEVWPQRILAFERVSDHITSFVNSAPATVVALRSRSARAT